MTMRKFLTDSKATVDDSEKLMFPKKSHGKVRLPPLATTVVIENYGWREDTRHKEDEDGTEGGGIFSGNTYPSATDNLITPKVFKLPTSPSNLSIQFNFDDVRIEPKQLAKCKAKDGKRSHRRKGHKRTTIGPNEETIGKSKYHDIHRSGERTPASWDVKSAKVTGRYRTLSNASVVKSTSSARGRKANAKTMKSATFSAERLSSTVARLDVNEDENRKSSIYDLREFLSLPADGNEEKIPPVLKKDIMRKTSAAGKGKHAKVKHAKNNPKLYSALHNKPSEEYMYDLFEFLTLAEQEKPVSLRRKGKKKLRGSSKVEKVPTTQGNNKPSVVEKSGIPSVVVADWSLKEDHTPRELPKVDLPTNDFPGRSEVILAPSDDPRRTSIYNLQEILNLNTPSRNSTVKNVATHKPEPSRELEAQCDLQEFLAFLESRASNHRGSESNGGPESGVSPERTAATPLVDTYRSRTISVHDIYEFLKSTSSTNLQNGELQMHVRTADSTSLDDFQQNLSNRKTSVITLKDFCAESSRSECPVNDKHKLATCEANNRSRSSSSNSMYNLRDFLGLPAVATNYERSRAECHERSLTE